MLPHCSEYSKDHFSKDDLYAPRQSIQARNGGEHTKAAMIRTDKYKYVHRLQEEDEFYILSEGENSNHIHDPAYADEIANFLSASVPGFVPLLLLGMVFCGILGSELDSRLNRRMNERTATRAFEGAMLLVMGFSVYNDYKFVL